MVAIAFAAAGMAAWAYFRPHPDPIPNPPDVDLDHVELMVANLIRDTRARLVASPTSASSWGDFGMALHGHGFHAQAKVCYAQAEKLDPLNAMWPYLTGDCDRFVKDNDAAMACFRRAADRPGSSVVSSLRLGELLVEAGRFDDAETIFRQVHRQNPAEPRAHLGIARIQLARNNHRASILHIDYCLAQTGDMPLACELLSQAYHTAGEQDLAEDARRRASRPSAWLTWNDPYLEILAKWQTGLAAIGRRAIALTNLGRHAEALALLDDLVHREPNSAKAHCWYGRSLVMADQIDEGEKQLREALQLDPDYIEARFYFGATLAKKQRYPQAIVELKKVVAAQPDHGDAHAKLGNCHYMMGAREEAASEMAIALRYQPNDGLTHKNLGIILTDLGRPAEAIKYFKMAATLLPDDQAVPILLNRAKVAASQLPK